MQEGCMLKGMCGGLGGGFGVELNLYDSESPIL